MANQTVKTKRKSAPVTSHPLFPAIVALWFAALFGLGSLAIRPTLLEDFVLATHLDTLISAAAPPLGVTARILLALVLAVIGGLAGASIAKRLTRPKVVHERKRGASALSEAGLGEVSLRARDMHPDAPARRPISAHDEIGGSRIESVQPAAAVLPGRRRSLAISDEGSRSEYHDFAPLPGGTAGFPEPQVLDLTEIDLGEFAEITEPDADYPAAVLDVQPPQARQIFGRPPVLDAAPDDFPPFTAPPADFSAPAAAFTPPAPALLTNIALPEGSAAEQIVSAPLDSLGLVGLTERFALSLQRRREAAEHAVAQVAVPEVVAAVPEAADPVAVPPAGVDVVLPCFARMGLPDFAAPVEAAPSIPMAMPASLRPLDFGDPADDDDEDYASFLPLRKMSMPVAPPFEEPPTVVVEDSIVEEPEAEAASDDDIDEDDGYSSLLGLSQTASPRQQFVRIEEPEVLTAEIEPVVIFPGQAARNSASPAPAAIVPSEVTSLRRFDAPSSAAIGQPIAASAPTAAAPDAEETERALRAALATLQRMSGAA